MMQTCRSINEYVGNTDICWDLHERLWIAWECIPIDGHSISKKIFQNMAAETLRQAYL